MNKTLRIGCLDTQSGRWQGAQVDAQLKPSNLNTSIIPTSDPAKLHQALLDGSLDIVAINASLVGLELTDELEIIAFTERHSVNSVTVQTRKVSAPVGEGTRVGIASNISLAFTRHYYPKAEPFLESDIDACINNLKSGAVDMLIVGADEFLPYASDEFTLDPIETSYFVPSAGQASISVLCHKKLSFRYKELLQRWVNHEETEDCIRIERSFLKSLPAIENMVPFSYAHFEGALLTLKGGLIATNGIELIKTKKSAALGDAKELGKKVSLEVARLLSEQRIQAM